MTTYIVSSGQVFSSALGPSDVASVLSSGTTSGVQDGGKEIVFSGGLSEYDTVLSGGVLVLSSGAIGSAEVINFGGVLSGAGILTGAYNAQTTDYGFVSGVDLSGADVFAGASQLTVAQGGSAAAIKVDYFADLYNNGFTSGDVVLSSGFEDTSSGGSSYALTISSGGAATDETGGIMSGVGVKSGGFVTLSSGATAEAVTVSSGGAINDFDLIVSNGQRLATPPSSVTATTVIDGVTLLSGAQVVSTQATVLAGGVLSNPAGAVLNSVIVLQGGTLSGSGTISGATVYGLMTGGDVNNAGGGVYLEVSSGGVASTVFVNGAVAEVHSGGSAVGVSVGGANATLQIDSGGTATGTVIEYGANQGDGGTATGTIVENGGEDYVVGSSLGETASSGATVSVSGLISGATILSNAQLNLGSGATAENVTVSSGGKLNDYVTVSSGQHLVAPAGAITATTVIDGVTLDSGAQVNGFQATVLSDGVLSLGGQGVGYELVSHGGVVSGPGDLGGGDDYGLILGGDVGYENTLNVWAGGIASGVTLENGLGNSIQVQAGGSAVGTIDETPFFDVYGGGVATGTIVLSGGDANDYGVGRSSAMAAATSLTPAAPR
jgi:fibronectin-binding autotransporter adhesin